MAKILKQEMAIKLFFLFVCILDRRGTRGLNGHFFQSSKSDFSHIDSSGMDDVTASTVSRSPRIPA